VPTLFQEPKHDGELLVMIKYHLIVAGMMLLPSVAVSQSDSKPDTYEAKVMNEIADALLDGKGGLCKSGDERCLGQVAPATFVQKCRGEGSQGGGACVEHEHMPGHCVCIPATPPPKPYYNDAGE